MAETGFAKRENILAAMAATVTKRSMRTARLSAMRTPENARDDQVICRLLSVARRQQMATASVSAAVLQKAIRNKSWVTKLS